MKYRIIGKTSGMVMLVEAACLVLMLLVSLIYRESPMPFVWTILILAVPGGLLMTITRGPGSYSARGGFATVVVVWLLLGIFGALPFYFSGYFKTFIDCVFESISGFTTTGSTILTEIESLPKGILMWRSFTHFLGGMGILVLTSALLPSSGARSHYLMQAEVPGPTSDKLVPSLAKSSKILYGIYAALTAVECVCLLISGLPLYDALCVSFATAGTGGFAVLNNSIAGYNSVAVDLITSVFMLLFSVNFTVYFMLLSGRAKQALKSDELRFFFGFVAAVVILITLSVYNIYGSLSESLLNAFFVVSSTVSTTGFGLPDYNLWPSFSHVLIVILMICGACAGSTGGGLKSSRVVMLFKSISREVKQIIHPRSVNIVRMDGKAVSDSTLTSVLRFVGAYFAITLIATLIISVDNFDLTTNLTAVISCMSNIGPGLNAVGPMENFSIFSGFSKIFLSICMLIGRLEIFPIIVFLSPSTWKKT